MTPTYKLRIEAARACLREAEQKRDAEYPGSPRWERLQGDVAMWEQRIEDLRTEQATMREG